ncbi:hypothetical protein D3C74_380050 [compost metagenome]
MNLIGIGIIAAGYGVQSGRQLAQNRYKAAGRNIPWREVLNQVQQIASLDIFLKLRCPVRPQKLMKTCSCGQLRCLFQQRFGQNRNFIVAEERFTQRALFAFFIQRNRFFGTPAHSGNNLIYQAGVILRVDSQGVARFESYVRSCQRQLQMTGFPVRAAAVQIQILQDFSLKRMIA